MKSAVRLDASSLCRCSRSSHFLMQRRLTVLKNTRVPSSNMSVIRRVFSEGQMKHPKPTTPRHSAEPAQMSATQSLQQRLADQPQVIGKTVSSAMDIEPPEISDLLKSFPSFVRNRIRAMSIPRKILAVLFIAACLFGDFLDRQLIENEGTDKSYSFLPGGAEEHILMNLHTGDLVCFARPLFSYNPLNSIRVMLRQFIADGPYEHCGIILRNEHDGNQAYVLELNLNTSRFDKFIARMRTKLLMNGDGGGSSDDESKKKKKIDPLSEHNLILDSGYKLTTFEERVLNSREKNICVRSVRSAMMLGSNLRRWSDWVEYHTTKGAFTASNMTEYDEPDDFEDDGHDNDGEWGNTGGMDSVNVHKLNDSENRWNTESIRQINDLLVNDVCFQRDSIKQLFLVMTSPGDNTIALRSRIRELKRNIRLIEHDIATQRANKDYVEVPKDILLRTSNQLKTVFRGARNTEEMESDHRKLYVDLVLKNRTLRERNQDVNPKRTLRSAEMVGRIWVAMGFIDEETGVKPWELRHQHFTDQTISIPMNDDSTLANIVYVRTGFEVGDKVNADDRPL